VQFYDILFTGQFNWQPKMALLSISLMRRWPQ
jgi:hypothetical protein